MGVAEKKRQHANPKCTKKTLTGYTIEAGLKQIGDGGTTHQKGQVVVAQKRNSSMADRRW